MIHVLSFLHSGNNHIARSRCWQTVQSTLNSLHCDDIQVSCKRYFSDSPVLSAQLITAPTGRPKDILNLAPADPPRP
ncbi:hypothetical protein ALC62_09223 [Cyphomyrmex costatus]|uniref:Uncharacterized protein n=1 Tax=Cyphomyrmex costatus TaxID=456900 RepID=A0A151IFR1_9HYME|nr:hypothetical protein ALC62_09223 [Cyphomyrmex costatus]